MAKYRDSYSEQQRCNQDECVNRDGGCCRTCKSPPGPRGPAGTQGPAGEIGPQGTQGLTGATGLPGSTGAQGPAGPVGAQGPAGEPGAQGPQGLPGMNGLQGPAGPPGLQGSAGDIGQQGSQGLPGMNGLQGPAGPPGLQGPEGDMGPQGLRGPAGDGAIIPFASGIPVSLTSIAGGLAGLPAFVGFGNSVQGLTLLGSSINLTNPAGTLSNFAFIVPRDGTITGTSAFFSCTVGLSLIGSSINVNAQLYQSTAPNNNLTPISGTLVQLTPDFGGVITIGDIAYGTLSGLSIPVTTGTRLMLVYSITSSGISLLNTLAGYASAGVAIS